MNLLKDPWFWVHTLGCYFLTTVSLRLGIPPRGTALLIFALALLWEYLVDHKRWIFKSLADPKGPDVMDVGGGIGGIAGALVIWP